jgi:membrane protein
MLPAIGRRVAPSLSRTRVTVAARYGPSRRDPKWRLVTWGSATAAVLWLAASMLFSWYVANFDSYNKT